MSEKKQPDVRFKGFQEDWVTKKLDDVIEVCSGCDYKHLSSGNIPVYGTGGYMLSVDKALSYKDDAIGIGRKGTIDKPYLLRAPFWTVDTLFYAVPKKDNDINFLFCIIDSIDWKKKDESTGVPSLSKVTINSVDTFVTKESEQIKIGKLFKNLDNLISLNQSKYDKLVSIKKACLKKMFPKDGADTPEIRFKGFGEKWEINELDTVTDVRDGTHSSPKYLLEGHPFITSKNIKDGQINLGDIQYISTDDFDEINKRSKVNKNDILMGMIGTIGNLALVRNEPNFAIKNVALIKDIAKINYLFLFYFLQSPLTSKYLDNGMDGGTQKFVSLSKIRTLPIFMPTPEEQTQIGNFFQDLDNLISLRKTELDKLKNIKKALLEKMFI